VIEEPPHLPQLVLDRLETAEGHQPEDQAVDVLLDLGQRPVPTTR
jgi:hypothetical protein